jgi:hypothetical protein
VEITEILDKIKRGFAPHNLELDDWGSLQYIIVDGERIGIISEVYKGKTKLPKIHYEADRLPNTAYNKNISTQIFNLIKDYLKVKKANNKKLTDAKKMKMIKLFQNSCLTRLEQLKNDGKIDYDKLKNSKSTESVYLYKGKRRILRISTHPSYLKSCNDNSIIITQGEIDNIENIADIIRTEIEKINGSIKNSQILLGQND